jgi:hypothetical protein
MKLFPVLDLDYLGDKTQPVNFKIPQTKESEHVQLADSDIQVPYRHKHQARPTHAPTHFILCIA